VVMFQVKVFWVVTPCGIVVGYQRFRGPYCLHLHLEDLRKCEITSLDRAYVTEMGDEIYVVNL